MRTDMFSSTSMPISGGATSSLYPSRDPTLSVSGRLVGSPGVSATRAVSLEDILSELQGLRQEIVRLSSQLDSVQCSVEGAAQRPSSNGPFRESGTPGRSARPGGNELFNISIKPGVALKTQLVAHLRNVGFSLNTTFTCVGEQMFTAQCKIVSAENANVLVSSPVCKAARKKDAELEAIRDLLTEFFGFDRRHLVDLS